MPTFRVVFFGLISHVGTAEQKHHAVIVRDEDEVHTPRIYFSPNSYETITGGVVTFSTGRAAVDGSEIAGHLPPLSRLSNGRLRNDVMERTNTTEAHAYVDYAASDSGASPVLRPRDYHNPAGRYTFNATQIDMCVARSVVLEVPLRSATIGVSYNGKIAVVNSSSCILIVNAQLSNLKDDARTHVARKADSKHEFKEHKQILAASAIGTVAKLPDLPCDQPPPVCNWIDDVITLFRDGAEIECSNSQWP